MQRQGTRVLIVDDSATDRELVRRELERCGYEVYEASDRASALRKVREVDPHCVLLDLRLNGEWGYEFLPELVGFPARPKRAVVILTEIPWRDLELGARCLGAKAFLIKRDADFRTLDAAIQKAIS